MPAAKLCYICLCLNIKAWTAALWIKVFLILRLRHSHLSHNVNSSSVTRLHRLFFLYVSMHSMFIFRLWWLFACIGTHDVQVWNAGKCVAVMTVWNIYVLVRDESSARMTHFGQEWVFSPHGKTSGEPATGFCYSEYQALWEKHCVNIVFKGFGCIANNTSCLVLGLVFVISVTILTLFI